MLNNILLFLYINLPLPFRYRSYLAKIACPDDEPLHFSHDGCPCCDSLAYEAYIYGYHSSCNNDD